MNANMPLITITIPMPVSQPESVNVYLIPVEPYTLIDAAFKSPLASRAIYGALDQHGIRLSQIERIIITHGHPDHFGMVKELKEKTGAEVFVHTEDAHLIRGEYALFKDKSGFLSAAGTPANVMEMAVLFERALNAMSESLEEVTAIHEGYKFKFNGFSLETLHLPGHSNGHICLYSPEKRVLFSGDLVLPRITTIPVVEYDQNAGAAKKLSVLQLIDSLSRLGELPVDMVYPSHGEIVTNPHQLITSRKSFYLQRLEEFYSRLLFGPPVSTYELAMAYFQGIREIKGLDTVLAMAETAANLEVLLDQERINKIIRNGVAYFYAGRS